MLKNNTLLMFQSSIDLFMMCIPLMEMSTKDKPLMITKTATLMVQVTSMESRNHTMTLTTPMSSITKVIRALLMMTARLVLKHLPPLISLA